MKQVLVALVLITLVFQACNTPEKLLVRQWKLVDVEFNEKEYNITLAEKPEMVKQLRDSCLFVFYKDHTYSFKLPQRTEVGTWEFSRGKDTIFTKTEHGGAASKVNVLSKIALDVNSHAGNASMIHYVLAPVVNVTK